METAKLECPNCGSSLEQEAETCPYCGSPVIIKSASSLSAFSLPLLNKYMFSYQKQIGTSGHQELKSSLGAVLLKMRQYDKAKACFDEAIMANPMDEFAYFLYAVASLKGGKAFLAPRAVIDDIEIKLDCAISISPKPIYYLFRAYIRYDHHARKGYRVSPTYVDYLIEARSAGLKGSDYDELFSLLGVNIPSQIVI